MPSMEVSRFGILFNRATTMSPFELITLAPDVQQLIRCLIREPNLTAHEIATRLGRSPCAVQGLLQQLLLEGRIVEENGRFTVRIEQPKRPAGLLETLYP